MGGDNPIQLAALWKEEETLGVGKCWEEGSCLQVKQRGLTPQKPMLPAPWSSRDFQTLELQENKFLFKPLRLWYFVMVAEQTEYFPIQICPARAGDLFWFNSSCRAALT